MLKKFYYIYSILFFVLILSSCSNLFLNSGHSISFTLDESTAKEIQKTLSKNAAIDTDTTLNLVCSIKGRKNPEKTAKTTINTIDTTQLEINNIPFEKEIILEIKLMFNEHVIYKGESTPIILTKNDKEKAVNIEIKPVKAKITYINDGNVISADLPGPVEYFIDTNPISTLKDPPTKTDYTFDCWYFDEDGNYPFTSLGSNNFVGDVTLYARWIYNPYNLTLKPSKNGNTIYFGDYPQSVQRDVSQINTTQTYIINGWTCYKDRSEDVYYVKVESANPHQFMISNNSVYTRFDNHDNPINNKKKEDTIKTNKTYYFKLEPVAWTKISDNYKSKDNLLLLSDKALCPHKFDSNSNQYINSELQQYMQNEFFDNLFTDYSKTLIQKTELSNSINDKIFILENSEIDTLDNSQKVKKTTEYARAIGAYSALTFQEDTTKFEDKNYKNSQWWTRTPDAQNSGNVYIRSDKGLKTTNGYGCVDVSVVPAITLPSSFFPE